MLSISKRFLSAIVIVAQSVSAQTADSHCPEKAFLFTDKTIYQAGEMIWFKVDAVTMADHSISDFSNTVYAELLDSGHILLHQKMLLKKGTGTGAFEIPEDAHAGIYKLKVYTSHMKYVSPDLYFEKNIGVNNDRQPAGPPLLADHNKDIGAISQPGVIIRPDKLRYSTRDKITVNIELGNETFTLYQSQPSISVYRTDTLSNADEAIAAQVQKAYTSSVSYLDAEPFYGSAEEKYQLDNYVRFNSMEEVFQEYIRGVGMTADNNRRLFVYDNLTRTAFRQDPMVIIDGTRAKDIKRVLALDPMKIKTIEVVTRKYFYGHDIFYGIINLTSYNSDMAGYEADEQDTVSSYESVPPQRIFDNPVYAGSQQKNSRHPDFRSTLYWHPNLNADSNGRRQVQFYSSDMKGTFRILLQGITPDGKLSCSSTDFTVD